MMNNVMKMTVSRKNCMYIKRIHYSMINMIVTKTSPKVEGRARVTFLCDECNAMHLTYKSLQKAKRSRISSRLKNLNVA